MRVVVSWSGGKESCLAHHKSVVQGHEIAFLITFILDDWPSVCHPLSIMSLQSEALETRHLTFKVREPYLDGYRNVISNLARKEGIEGIVTGDIWIDDHRRWMENVCSGLPVVPIIPLWGADRAQLLAEFVSQGFKAVFTCVKEPWFNEKWLGRQLDKECLIELGDLQSEFGIDRCGENGEYHTMVLDGPTFSGSIRIEESSREKKDSMFFLKAHRLSLQRKVAQSEDSIPENRIS